MKKVKSYARSTLHLVATVIVLSCMTERLHLKCFTRLCNKHSTNIDGMKVYIDNLVTWAENKEQHGERLFQVLGRARQMNLMLYLNKCEFRVVKITYLGEVLSEDGV